MALAKIGSWEVTVALHHAYDYEVLELYVTQGIRLLSLLYYKIHAHTQLANIWGMNDYESQVYIATTHVMSIR